VTFRERLATGRFVVTTELVPPRGADGDACRRRAAALVAFADAVNVTDGAGAAVRMAALAAASFVVAEGGEPIVQMTTRDRNRIALAADALGAAAIGAPAVLPLFGDPVARGEDPGAVEVREMETVGLIELVAGLNAGHTPGGRTLDSPPSLLIGTAGSPAAPPDTLTALVAKLDAGATFVQTQMTLDLEGFRGWMEHVRAAGLDEQASILAGVAVPGSAAAAERFRSLGGQVPDAAIDRAAEGEGLDMAYEIVEGLAATPGVAGVHLYPLSQPADVIAGLAAHARAAARA
jgi:methylenetetrahydrofolate reductase (NADPH)